VSEKQKFQTKQTLLNSDMETYLEYKNNFDDYFSSKLGANFVATKDELVKKQNVLLKELEKYEKIMCDYEIQQENQIILNKIEELEKSLDELKEIVLENYERYKELQNENIKLLTDNEKLENGIEKVKIKIGQLNNKIDQVSQSLQTIEKWNDEYTKYIMLKDKYDLFVKNFSLLEKKVENAKKEKLKIELQNGKINDDVTFIEKILNGVYKNVEKIKNYEILHESLKNKGFYDLTLENIITNLQRSLNIMCDYIGHERINIALIKTTGEKQIHKMLISSYKIPDMANAGGFEKNFVELLFKMAFLKINSRVICDFLMLDEIYDACSEDNKHMAIKLVEFFRLHYKKMLVVSHNPTITGLFDSTFEIKYDPINGNTLHY
jgi:DNA repair exonuclease SbcCD ATPase subunit